jgi:hypothetical protein
VTSVKRVTDIIADISAASQEQSSGIEQVSHVITHMDEGTQQNAALVEEATAAARSLEQQSGHLVQTVAAFRLEADSGQAQARPHTTAIDRISGLTGAAANSPVDNSANRPAASTPSRPTRAKPKAAAGNDQHWQEF